MVRALRLPSQTTANYAISERVLESVEEGLLYLMVPDGTSTMVGQRWPPPRPSSVTVDYYYNQTSITLQYGGYYAASSNYPDPPRRRPDRSIDTPHFKAGAAGKCCPPVKLQLAIHREYSTWCGYDTFTPKSITRAEVSSWRPRRLVARRAYKPVRSRPGMR
jgi:hypothetical protein